MAHEYSLKQGKNHTQTMFNSFKSKRLNCVTSVLDVSELGHQASEGQRANRRQPRGDGCEQGSAQRHVFTLTSWPCLLACLPCLC